ncbi:MAG: peptidylprolyl isomerase, partial [Planctomycetes bacterium]|nr:peptidylprolyl isomerase [Planctomycetota bacterium]
TVAGRDLTASDVLAFIQEYAQPARIRGPVEILIRNKQVLHEAEKLGLLPAPLDIEKVISDIREEIATQNRMRHSTVHLTLNGLLESQGRTLEEFKDSLQIRAEAARLKLLGSALSDEALAQEYENNQADYLIIKCSHILLAYDSERPYNPKDVTVEQKEAIHKISEEVEKLLQEDNDYPLVALPVFEKLVRTYTSCPSRVWKGDIGYTANTPALAPFLPPMAYNLDFLHDDANRAYSPISARFALLLPEFLPTVRALRDGEVSKPIETSYGIHIFRRDEARYPTHWQAIRGLLYDHRRQRLTLELDQKLQEKYPVKYYWEILKKEED